LQEKKEKTKTQNKINRQKKKRKESWQSWKLKEMLPVNKDIEVWKKKERQERDNENPWKEMRHKTKENKQEMSYGSNSKQPGKVKRKSPHKKKERKKKRVQESVQKRKSPKEKSLKKKKFKKLPKNKRKSSLMSWYRKTLKRNEKTKNKKRCPLRRAQDKN